MKIFILSLLSLLCNCALTKIFGSNKEQKFIHDSQGRITIYHGVNVSNYSKNSLNYLPWQTKEDFKKMKDWGLNLVRYLIFWDALEPQQSVYDENYMLETIQRIQWLKELEIDVIIDIHQDLYSKKFTGNGFPEWTVNDNNLKFNERQPWNLNYLEPAVVISYTNFWKSSLKNNYIKMLKYVFKSVDSLDNVIGIDVMNEPFPGLTLNFEKKVLTEFYNDIQMVIKSNNFKKKIIFEPCMVTSAGVPTNLKFKPDICIYSPHYYDPLCHEGKPYKELNKKLLQLSTKIKSKEANKFGVPILYGEIGIPKVQNYENYLIDLLNEFDKYSIGWCYYSYDFNSGFSFLDDQKECMKQLVRVYPQKIAGLNPHYILKKGYFLLEYTSTECFYQTEVFIPKNLKNVKVTINRKSLFNIEGTKLFYQNDCFNSKQSIEIIWDE